MSLFFRRAPSVLAIGLAVSAAAAPGADALARVSAAALPEGVYRRKVVTSDGVALAAYRYVPPGASRAQPPVLLVADLALSREVFDLDGVGLARHLQENGRDVYVVEPRGHGRSDVPVDWRLADFVRRDLPAVVAAIARDREGPVDVVAHGYLGTLLMVASVEELQGRIGRVVALSTPALIEVPNKKLEAILEAGGRFERLAETPEGRRELTLLYANHGAFRRGVVDAVLTRMANLGGAASRDVLAWMRSGDLELTGGDTVSARLRRYDRPTLLMLPLANNVAHSEFAAPLREIATDAKVQVRVLSRFELHGEDYGQLSMLQGEHAERDVWNRIVSFLAAGIEVAR